MYSRFKLNQKPKHHAFDKLTQARTFCFRCNNVSSSDAPHILKSSFSTVCWYTLGRTVKGYCHSRTPRRLSTIRRLLGPSLGRFSILATNTKEISESRFRPSSFDCCILVGCSLKLPPSSAELTPEEKYYIKRNVVNKFFGIIYQTPPCSPRLCASPTRSHSPHPTPPPSP